MDHKRIGSADVAAILRREITRGDRLEHDKLPAERTLAEGYGVSRGTVREALLRLEREGLVAIRRGSGTYVTYESNPTTSRQFGDARPLELVDARFALEPHICRLVVLHGRKSDFDELETLLDEMERAVDNPMSFSEADQRFHETLAKATGNGLLLWLINQVSGVRTHDEWSQMRSVTLDRKTVVQYNVQHRQIVNAIRAREPERAATLMKGHLETARLSITRAADT